MVNTPLFIARRIIFNNQPSFSRFIIRLAVVATTISVAAMIITLGMVNGFQDTVAAKVYSFWGHARVQALEPPRSLVAEEANIKTGSSIEGAIKSNPNVAHWYPFAAKSVVLKSKTNFEGLIIKGVGAPFSNPEFGAYLREGRMLQLTGEDFSRDLMISEQTARQLEAGLGDTLQVLFIRQGQDIRSRNLVVTGIFRTGIEEYDRHFALADLRFLQQMNRWDSTLVGGYELWLHDHSPETAAGTAAGISALLPQGVVAQTVNEIMPNIFDWLAIQNQTKLIVISIMTAVAAINLITCLLILVMERTRMVGALKAFGLPERGIRSIFWYYAAWIALTGIGAGLVLGLGILYLQLATGFISMDEATYYVDRMPVKIIWWQVAAVITGSFVLCVAALRLPLFFVGRITPVRALRFG